MAASENGFQTNTASLTIASRSDSRHRPISAVGRLKLNRYSPLSALVELELLHGEIDMRNALRSSVGNRADGIDFDELVHRAERQAEELERRRVDVAANALSSPDGSAVPRRSTPLAAIR